MLRGNVPRAGLVIAGKPIRSADVHAIDITGKPLNRFNPQRYFGTYHSAFAYDRGVLKDIESVLRGRTLTPKQRSPESFDECEFAGTGIKYWIMRHEEEKGPATVSTPTPLSVLPIATTAEAAIPAACK